SSTRTRAPGSRPDPTQTESGRTPQRPLADAVDPLRQLLSGGGRSRRAAALLAQRGVGDAVRLPGAVVPGGDQAVELAAQDGQLLVLGGRRDLVGGRQLGAPVSPLTRLLLLRAVGLPLTQQVAHLVGLEQSRDAEEVHLLVGP